MPVLDGEYYRKEIQSLRTKLAEADRLLHRWKLFGEGVDPDLARHLIADTNAAIAKQKESE